MKCAFHPQKNASTTCSACQKPLCEECAISQNNGRFICSGCAEQQAANNVIETIQQQKREKEVSHQADETIKKRQVMIFRVIPALFVVGILVANGYLYFKRGGIPGVEEPSALDNQIFAAAEVDSAIQDYIDKNKGKVPESLSDLNKSESLKDIPQADLNTLSYHKLSSTEYELIIRDIDNTPIVFAGGDEE